ncbi:MAG: amidohydrolase [Bacteroidota bacterium]|nr:amidohydrolase [Bacteroidota bacterium]
MKKILLILLASIFFVFMFMNVVSRKQHADLLVINALIYTVDDDNSKAEAMAIRGSRIISIGSTQDIQNHFTSQNTIDAHGKTIVPGLIDSHAHVMGLGQSLTELNLYGTTSSKQIADIVSERASNVKPGDWIRGRGWDQNDWGSATSGKPFPTAAILDKVSPNNPVILSRIDGHAIWVNSKAMELAKNKTDFKIEIDGGKILRNGLGDATGIFVDNAEAVIRNVVPEYSKEEKNGMYNRAFNECLKYGITSVHDMGIDEKDYEIYRELLTKQELPLRIYALISGNGKLWEQMINSGPYMDYIGKFLSVRSLKLYLDGALGSRGAAMIEPYSDEPESRGLITFSPDSIRIITEQALQKGFQVCVHAIGDRANRIALDEFEKASEKYPAQAHNARLRIEHAQVISLEDIPRFKKLNVIPSMQPTHATSDMYWVQARLGPERILGAYAWRSLIDDGNIIPAGSDFPVELPNPLLGFYAAITRQDKDGIPNNASDVTTKFQLSAEGIKDSVHFNGGWYAEQRLTREEALRSFTKWGAYAEFMENEKGSLDDGKLADFVILSKDIMTIDAKEILTTEVETTVVGGKIRYQKN